MNPILIINDPVEPVKKRRLIEIYKNNVYKDIELITFKHTDANVPDPKVNNAIAADNAEAVDGVTIARYVEFRDAQLRNRLQRYLAPVDAHYADDELGPQSKYVYPFLLDERFNDSTLRAVAEYIHRFLVYGALYDWYAQFGSAQAGIYAKEVDGLLDRISAMFQAPSIAKRPLQPFGPAQKIY